jgi:hypothetical protein
VRKGTVTCFTVIGDTAWVGGHRPGNDPPDVAFQVVDRGEGSGDPPDEVGTYFSADFWEFAPGFAQYFCEERPEMLYFGPVWQNQPVSLFLHPIEAGNIQIMVK